MYFFPFSFPPKSMAASESSEGPPDNATSPPGTSGTIVTSELQTTLNHLNDNMSSMAHILELIYKERRPPGNDNMKRAAPTRDSNSPLPHERPPKRARAELAGEYSADEDDSLSVTTSDNLENDVDELVNPSSVPASAEASTTEKFLEDIESILDSSEATGENLQPKLAEIANKRWGRKMAPDKLKELISKHLTPANCTEMIIPRVNPEIWAQMKAHKRRTDLRITNIQQSLQKASVAILQSGDSILKTPSGLADSVKKELVTHNIDAVALLGHAANELSLLRREQIKPTLKPEYYPICNTDIPNSQLLFGDDLAKRVRDAQDTSKLANKLSSTAKTQPRTGSRYGHFNKADKMRDNSRPFLGRGQRPFHRKKQQNWSSKDSDKKC